MDKSKSSAQILTNIQRGRGSIASHVNMTFREKEQNVYIPPDRKSVV